MNEPKQYGFYIDTTKCTGCKTCHVSCKDRSDLPKGLKWRRVYEYGGGSWQENGDGTVEQNVYSYYVSIGCNHCDNPVCVEVCPVGSMHKRRSDGLVHVDPAVCIGCEACAFACPYDAPQFDRERGIMTKCDGCYERLAVGRKPICVECCPLRAMDFGPMDELRARYGAIADINPLPSSTITKPNLCIKQNRNAQDGGDVLNEFEV
ncbi:dimethylsulfoxide reductase, chain B [Ferrimonas balearica DSM 9799]|uniref:Dimethylsulfoxide reductase, chain B n=1 Tax=Ferrimonas balearica (strain DSM 9799 / CCM 4581 / KCTC 23876 / PAT) TaxID=550540 RepID=E1STQ0_FERBD|nr:DMSO/selenate family reductase complex B subunit [Ferrimonas balearica]MBY6016648.1 dimethylsulfoxide reductase subunit B [Halomonas denitrificans]ADN76163.1 dimethylsulfoxide reductase, chain B [Ferrimonas balearica DSM 9799]MBW3139072.1 dimethylsulfoxide reductase subunit B [Ferrimonas balearica]MBW3163336.1 dimethylsulfoxide reductase subunit B [Ferrimonas balearica]MBY5981032.1 dimethylsulfoxide reductase subunit B [Ferrimonas balearica]